MINYLSFAATALFFGFWRVPRCDLLIWESPPLFTGPFAWLLGRLKGARCVMNVSDLWPESAVTLGLVSPDGLATRLAEKLEMWLYRHSDAVTGQTEGICGSISQRCPSVPVQLFPNGVDLAMFQPRPRDEAVAERFGLAGRFVVGYGGIIGYAQALGQILEAARRLEGLPDVLFTFFGDGPVLGEMSARAEQMGLKNVRFFGRQERALMPDIISCWDVGIVPLADKPLFEGARPSKMFELMGQAKPLIYCGRGEGAAIVSKNRCGLIVPPECPDKLAEAVRTLCADPEALARMGQAGRKAAETQFDRAAIAAHMAELFASVLREPR
jgi:glycosyltransferase involved in cell wall biosynthesis